MKQLTRQDFENLQVGTIIKTNTSHFLFQFIKEEIVFVITSGGTANFISIKDLNILGYTIQKPQQYYQGWEIGDYSGKNVWVLYDDVSEIKAIQDGVIRKLKEVTKAGFILNNGNIVKYAVQLTEVNTQNMKVK